MIALLLAAVLLPTVPGARNPDVTQATINTTICVPGWAADHRPSSSYTSALKRQQIRELGYTDTNPSSYEEDHLISIELGGSPRDPRNLWPEPWAQARRSDYWENRWHRRVCAGDWTLKYGRHVELQFKKMKG